MKKASKNTGLTLMEVMVAVVVMSMIGISVWTAVSQTSRTRKIVEESHERLHEVRLFFEMFSSDLESAYLSMHRAPQEPSHDTVFVGQNKGDMDRLDFFSFSNQRRFFDTKESDQCEIGYFITEDKDERDILNLVRRQSPILDDEPLEGGRYLVIVRDVVSFDLEYFDFIMNEWQDEWDTTEITGETAVLPHQVRVLLKVHDRLGREVSYGTSLTIPMRTAIWKKSFVPGQPITVNK